MHLLIKVSAHFRHFPSLIWFAQLDCLPLSTLDFVRKQTGLQLWAKRYRYANQASSSGKGRYRNSHDQTDLWWKAACWRAKNFGLQPWSRLNNPHGPSAERRKQLNELSVRSKLQDKKKTRRRTRRFRQWN